MMKKKLLIIIVCITVLLSACSSRLVGEAKAKEAGLAFINQVFDVNLSEAIVEYRTHAAASYVKGERYGAGVKKASGVTAFGTYSQKGIRYASGTVSK